MGKVSTPSHPSGQITAAVIGGGNKNSATGISERQDGAAPIFDPMRHSQQDVNLEDLWFSGLSTMPTAFGQNSFWAPPDPGTVVYVLKQAGEPGGIVLGMANTVRKKSGGNSGGGQDIMGGPIMNQLKDEKIPVNIPPEIEETTERGAKIRKIKEKGEEHSLGLLDGLPIHGALFQITGFKLPALNNIPTAKQTNDGMINNQMLQQMSGSIMSMSKMFQGLASNGSGGGAGGAGGQGASSGLGLGNAPSYLDSIHSNIKKNMIYDPQKADDIVTALNSLSKLVQGFESSTGGNSNITGCVVHYTIFLENATELLSQVTSVSDIMSVLQRLQSDTSLHGLDKLEPVEYEIDTAHGTVTQKLSYDGEIEIIMDSNTMNSINNWANTVTNPSSSPGAGSAPAGSNQGAQVGQGSGQGMQQMFGKSAQIMQDMFKRLTPKQEKEAKRMHQKLNTSDIAQKHNEIFKRVYKGEGDPMDKQLYEKAQSQDQQGNFGVDFAPPGFNF